ncbi:MAG: DUF3500 domain-containing protein [Opitutales bacterium]|nr:DUF3500 domain-containing protein [Opitutales bacterium]MDP4884706.1 DUF3500 domain-containing protein [Opitutales bacterium]
MPYPMITHHCRLRPISLAVLLFGCIQLPASQPTVKTMQVAATAFLNELSPELRTQASYPLDADERTNWHFVPKERNGVSLAQLDDAQEAKLTDLLAASLSESGYQKAANIQNLESVLFMLEGKAFRDPERYFATIFGDPAKDTDWGWRFEGHHLSLNYTIGDGQLITVTPNFWGANPATVPSGPHKGLRTLQDEEELARALIQSLNTEQQKSTIFTNKAPKDIHTRAKKEVTPLDPVGIRLDQLNAEQAAALHKTIQVYLGNMPADIARERWTKIQAADMASIRFAWAGSTKAGEPHYYRIQGPTFLIEYDNVQNKANHIHTVWRDFNGDFGRDIIREHKLSHSHE